MQEMDEIMDSADIDQEFKVFKDPTFNDFVKIFGKEHNKELPLYA